MFPLTTAYVDYFSLFSPIGSAKTSQDARPSRPEGWLFFSYFPALWVSYMTDGSYILHQSNPWLNMSHSSCDNHSQILSILRWHQTDWNECSKTCGKGSHSRLVYCRRKANESYFEIISDWLCDESAKPNITLVKQCNEVPCPAEWRGLPWSKV